MNNDTRVLSTKAMDEYDMVRQKTRDWMYKLLTSDLEQRAVEPERKSTEQFKVATFEC
jgi:hypothetical protein